MRLSAPSDHTDIDLDAIDLFDPALYGAGDPHPIWHALRRRAPVWHQRLADGREFWSVTRYRDACRVLKDHAGFTSEQGTLLCALDLGDPAGGRMMAATDPPRHTALREGLNRTLSARGIAARSDQLRVPVKRFLDPLLTGAGQDLAAAAASFPMGFIGVLMGLPEPDWPDLTRLTTMAIAPDDEDFRIGDSGQLTLVSAHQELFEYFSRQVAERDRAGSGDDLISQLMRMEVDGLPLPHEDVVYNCYSLILGANVTTPHTITATIHAFIEYPDSYRRVLGDRDLLRSCIEEGLRWSSPASHFMRYTTRQVEISGHHLPAGTAVAVWLGSANRDEDVFPEPYTFDVARQPNPHIAFGYGPHYCIGAALARSALELLFGELLPRVERFELTGEVEHLASNFIAGFKRFPVRAVPAAVSSPETG